MKDKYLFLTTSDIRSFGSLQSEKAAVTEGSTFLKEEADSGDEGFIFVAVKKLTVNYENPLITMEPIE